MDNGNLETVRVRVRRGDTSGEAIDVNLTPSPTRKWSPEHAAAVTGAVGIDARAYARVRLEYADGESEPIPATRGGWSMIADMQPGDVLVVDSTAAAPPAISPAPPLPRSSSLSWMQNRSQQR